MGTVMPGTDFAEVLSKAPELGYAERDPSSDIDGIDVRSKTMISASIAFDVICTDQIPMSGIRNTTTKELDCHIVTAKHGKIALS